MLKAQKLPLKDTFSTSCTIERSKVFVSHFFSKMSHRGGGGKKVAKVSRFYLIGPEYSKSVETIFYQNIILLHVFSASSMLMKISVCGAHRDK